MRLVAAFEPTGRRVTARRNWRRSVRRRRVWLLQKLVDLDIGLLGSSVGGRFGLCRLPGPRSRTARARVLPTAVLMTFSRRNPTVAELRVGRRDTRLSARRQSRMVLARIVSRAPFRRDPLAVEAKVARAC